MTCGLCIRVCVFMSERRKSSENQGVVVIKKKTPVTVFRVKLIMRYKGYILKRCVRVLMERWKCKRQNLRMYDLNMATVVFYQLV